MEMFKYGLMVINPKQEGEMMDILHFAGYWRKPTQSDIDSLREELHDEPEFGLQEIWDIVEILPTPPEILELYQDELKERIELLNLIKSEMRWYGFDLTDSQIDEYINETEIECFDTVEREDYSSYLAKKITGMDWPINADEQSYKDKFYKLLAQNAPKHGIKWGQNTE